MTAMRASAERWRRLCEDILQAGEPVGPQRADAEALVA